MKLRLDDPEEPDEMDKPYPDRTAAERAAFACRAACEAGMDALERVEETEGMPTLNYAVYLLLSAVDRLSKQVALIELKCPYVHEIDRPF